MYYKEDEYFNEWDYYGNSMTPSDALEEVWFEQTYDKEDTTIALEDIDIVFPF